jgi:O-antigen ligase
MQPIAAILLIALPWLNPFSAGPQPAIPQQLFSGACVAGLLIIWDHPSKNSSDYPWVPRIALAWLVAALVSAALALLQYFGLSAGLDPWVNSTNAGVAYANLRQRNQFATLTSIGLLAALWQVAPAQYQGHHIRSPSIRTVLGFGPLLVLLALGNAASGSRTGLLQWLLVAALTALWAPRGQWRVRLVTAGALLAYLLAIVALPALLEAFTGIPSGGLLARFSEEPGCSSRRVMWSNVLQLIAQKPWLGWGWGELDYAHFITLYPAERFCEILDNAHNLPLQLAVELGVPLAALACAVTCWLVWQAKPWRERDPSRQMAWGVLAVILLHSLVEYPLWYGPFQMAAGLCVWLLWRHPEGTDKKGLFRAVAPVLPACLATLLIAFVGFAGWDYWRVSQLYLPLASRASGYREGALEKVRSAYFFQDQVHFAELTTTPLTPGNAENLHAMARQLLHFSPEPRVVEKLIESAVMLGRDDEARFYLLRFKAAFPKEHARWADSSASHKTP